MPVMTFAVLAPSVLRLEVGGEELVAGRDDDGADVDLDDLLLHVEVDRVRRARGDALPALRADAAVEAAARAGERLLLGERRLDLVEGGRGRRVERRSSSPGRGGVYAVWRASTAALSTTPSRPSSAVKPSSSRP